MAFTYTNEQLGAAGINPERLTVVDHPVLEHHMMTLRDRELPPQFFGMLLRNVIAPALVYEASRRVPMRYDRVVTPTGAICEGQSMHQNPLVVTIPRAGDAFADAAMNWFGSPDKGFINIARIEAEGARPHVSDIKIPKECDVNAIFVFDTMLATGGSMNAALQLLMDRGARPEAITTVSAIASIDGVAAVHGLSSDIHVLTAALDPELNEIKFIMPGLGDAGDRTYGKSTAVLPPSYVASQE